ncbi:hypothetical protein HHK36_011947 [Tetracentron sinense]|uniref:RING-type E3 ubiquitin transferase n=1 Tax=Tetracentron sinense TaxID=13715 RepID=A0A834ZCG2_TETSI|nr:hypothetical protein HHK36_011947 [Tetracentron sinense]
MSKRVLCKFFAHGACLKGENCEFSHDWKDQSNNICTFYQKGVCSYGSRCRYEHVKASRSPASVSSSSTNSGQHLASYSIPVTHPSRIVSSGVTTPVPGVPAELSALSKPFFPPSRPAWDQDSGDHNFFGNEDGEESTIAGPADRPICSFAAAGSCPRGERCPHIHGDLCPTCGKHCLHPYKPDEREEHIKTCETKKKHLDALKRSQEIECCVCLDRVLQKPTAAERKFGLLSECDHPFCISCIRNWRSNSPASGMDVNTALRTCPICRKLSYFVIPSVIWCSTKEEKQEIIDSYKAKLRSIDCRYFDFGNGTCPFGTSCFYTHAYPDGSLEEVVLRHLGAEDGGTVIAKDIRIFITFEEIYATSDAKTYVLLSVSHHLRFCAELLVGDPNNGLKEACLIIGINCVRYLKEKI